MPGSGRLPGDVQHRWGWPLMAFSGGIGAWLLTRLVPASAAEALYGRVGPVLARGISAVTGALPFAASELLATLYAVWLVSIGVIAVRTVLHGNRRWTNALAGGAWRVVRDGGLLLLGFYLLWGLNYARPTFPVQAGWPEWTGVDVAELVTLAEAATAAANHAYLELHGTADAGAPTELPADLRALESALDDGWRRAAALLPLSPVAAVRFGPVKWPRSSGMLARLGISGIYVPFTAEAHVVRGLPAMRVPISMAHEKAHQRGFTSEADANFLGYVASALAPDPLSRYSAAMFAHTQLLSALGTRAPEEWRRLAGSRLPGVQRDLEDLSAYARRLQGPASRVGTRLNDRYLVAQGIRDGVQDYRRSAWLIVTYARRNGGQILPAPRS